MRTAPAWRAGMPTSRDIRFAAMRWLDRKFPSVCRGISVSVQQAEFGELAACEPLTICESAARPFPEDWLARFERDFLLEHGTETRTPESAALELQYAICNDAWVLGHTGQIVDARTNRSITPVTRGSVLPRRLAADKLGGVGFSLLTGRPGYRKNYYHFLTQTIPEHLALLRAAVDAFGQLTLLLPDSDHPLEAALASEAVRRFPDLPVRRIGLSEKVRCEAVVMHRVRRSNVFPSPPSRRFLSETVEAMRQSFPVVPAAGRTRHLFVSRADAKKRRLVNEDEIMARLAPFDFEAVTPGRLPVADQIALFSEAKIVAGPHGAGLTNIAFMPAGGSVIEIFRPDWVLGTYAWLSYLGGHAYGHVVGDEAAANLGYRLSGKALDAFEREVEAALERPVGER